MKVVRDSFYIPNGPIFIETFDKLCDRVQERHKALFPHLYETPKEK